MFAAVELHRLLSPYRLFSRLLEAASGQNGGNIDRSSKSALLLEGRLTKRSVTRTRVSIEAVLDSVPRTLPDPSPSVVQIRAKLSIGAGGSRARRSGSETIDRADLRPAGHSRVGSIAPESSSTLATGPRRGTVRAVRARRRRWLVGAGGRSAWSRLGSGR